MFEKLSQLSQLPAFNGGGAEHTLFVVFCIGIGLIAMLLIVLVANYLIKGFVEIWKLYFDMRKRSIDAKIEIERELTKQTQVMGQKPMSM